MQNEWKLDPRYPTTVTAQTRHPLSLEMPAQRVGVVRGAAGRDEHPLGLPGT